MADRSNKYVTLTDLAAERPARVRELRGGHAQKQRLDAMGIALGSVLVKQSSFFTRGPVVLEVGQTRIALGRGVASKVIVEPIEHS